MKTIISLKDSSPNLLVVLASFFLLASLAITAEARQGAGDPGDFGADTPGTADADPDPGVDSSGFGSGGDFIDPVTGAAVAAPAFVPPTIDLKLQHNRPDRTPGKIEGIRQTDIVLPLRISNVGPVRFEAAAKQQSFRLWFEMVKNRETCDAIADFDHTKEGHSRKLLADFFDEFPLAVGGDGRVYNYERKVATVGDHCYRFRYDNPNNYVDPIESNNKTGWRRLTILPTPISEPASDTATEPDAASDPDPASDTATEPDAATDPDPASDTATEPDAATDPEPEPSSEPDAASDPEPEPAFVPDGCADTDALNYNQGAPCEYPPSLADVIGDFITSLPTLIADAVSVVLGTDDTTASTTDDGTGDTFTDFGGVDTTSSTTVTVAFGDPDLIVRAATVVDNGATVAFLGSIANGADTRSVAEAIRPVNLLDSFLLIDLGCDGAGTFDRETRLDLTLVDDGSISVPLTVEENIPNGTHCFTFEVDRANAVTEGDELNNLSDSVTFVVAESALALADDGDVTPVDGDDSAASTTTTATVVVADDFSGGATLSGDDITYEVALVRRRRIFDENGWPTGQTALDQESAYTSNDITLAGAQELAFKWNAPGYDRCFNSLVNTLSLSASESTAVDTKALDSIILEPGEGDSFEYTLRCMRGSEKADRVIRVTNAETNPD